jgi:hypothetical protein
MVVDNHHSKLAVVMTAGTLMIFVVQLFRGLLSFIFHEQLGNGMGQGNPEGFGVRIYVRSGVDLSLEHQYPPPTPGQEVA